MESVNFFMPKDECSVNYHDIDYTVKAYLWVCESKTETKGGYVNFSCNALEWRWRNRFEDHRKAETTVFVGKSDLKSAFCMLGLSCDSWPWLVMRAQDPQTGVWKYFVDKCLTFGTSISCAHFQRFSNALCHLIEFKTNTQGQVTNYLDDFLFLVLTILACNALIARFIQMCN